MNKIGHGMLRFYLLRCAVSHQNLCVSDSALHELDPIFRKVTLENERLRQLVRDLKFHHNPVGEF